MSDNRGAAPSPALGTGSTEINTPPPPTGPAEPWQVVLQDLQDIKTRLGTLEKIGKSTEAHTSQLSGLIRRTTDLETAVDDLETTVDNNESQVKTLNAEVATLRKVVQEQEKTINNLKNIKKEVLEETAKSLSEMKDLVQVQEQQVKQFQDSATTLKQEISEETKGQIKEVKEECHYRSMKSQAQWNEKNLVITGLKEVEGQSVIKTARDFFSLTLGVQNLEIDVTYRLGSPPMGESTYIRPFVVKFTRLSERDRVWDQKIEITPEEEGAQKIRIHAEA